MQRYLRNRMGWLAKSIIICSFGVRSSFCFALQGHIPHFGPSAEIQFAAVGDYGTLAEEAVQVAQLIQSWKPAFIITMGDNNYFKGEAETIDQNIGKKYHEFIGNYSGKYGKGAEYRRFFPSLGNHDWDCRQCAKSPLPYMQYFSLQSDERYYDFVEGPVHFFALDSDPREADGTEVNSVQALWLKKKLAESTSAFNVVFFHHPPYSTGYHGDRIQMQWPFREWGASLILTGHDHIYERYEVDGIPYIVNGLGGGVKYPVGPRRPNCRAQYDQNYGAMKINANAQQMTLAFYSRDGKLIDHFSILAHSVSKTKPAAKRVQKY